MRQRKIKNLDEKLEGLNHRIVEDPKSMKGKWNQVFGNDNPIFLEIGCGKGQFITGNGRTYPDRNFIAVEGQRSVVLRAITKAEEEELSNVMFITDFINDIGDFFEEGELSGIYLNFSDPWPKERHAKRRLTYGKKLSQYCQVTTGGGFVQFKTDNDDLFDFTLEQIQEQGLKAEAVSRDLHSSPYSAGNITTEYEDKFSSTGKNINYVLIRVEK